MKQTDKYDSQRLRDIGSRIEGGIRKDWGLEIIEAASEIDSQAAEIERLRGAMADYLQAQDAVDNNEYQSMPDDFGKLNGRRKAARDDLDAALSGDSNANE